MVTENLEKTGTDALSGISASSLQDSTQRPKGPDRHKTLHTKINGTMGKVNKLINKVEQALPSLKRKLCPSSHKSMKEGLAAIRHIKDACMDQLEDLKQVDPDFETQEKNLEALQHILTSLQDAHDVMLEALLKHGKDEPMAKEEEIPSTPRGEGGHKHVQTPDNPQRATLNPKE